MPRKYRVTWQPGTGRRTGRWRRKYQGKIHYFPGGKGKTDRQAYEAALEAWERLKIKLDAEAPKSHQQSYEEAIEGWEEVREWCRHHGEQDFVEMAEEKLVDLRKRLLSPKLKPLDVWDTVEALYHVPTFQIPDDFARDRQFSTRHVRKKASVPLSPVLNGLAEYNQQLDGSPSRIAREIWQDRLATQKRTAATPEDSVRAHVEAFSAVKEAEALAQDITVGRLAAIIRHLDHFAEWLGPQMSVAQIDGKTLSDYRLALLKGVNEKKSARSTASDRLTAAKTFVRWLWQIDAIESLPKNMDGRSPALMIGRGSSEIVIFTKGEIVTLLRGASRRTRLYILLGLNVSATQKDIADLRDSEVDWDHGRIIRKRSKTRDRDSVPTVNYKLWSETIRLLQVERAPGSTGRVLLNANGGPLWKEEMKDGGHYVKNSNVTSAFNRLMQKTKVKKPFGSLKKTSATLLRDNEKFASVASLYLGHAPRTMAEKHYAQTPQRLFDDALDWLGKEYGIV